MKISVVIPIYNAEEVICRCIDSIIMQTTKPFQIICVNDGSTDSTSKLLDNYKEVDNLIIINKENGGEGSARNYGLDYVSPEADFIAFVDSDDWVRPTWLQDFVDNWNGEDVLFQNALWLKGKETMLERKVTLDNSKSLIEKIHHLFIHNSIGYVWAGIWRASIVRKFHLRFKKYRMWEDAVFSAEFLSYASNINIIPNAKCHDYGYVYQYPVNVRSYTTPNATLIEGYVERFNVMYRLYKKHNREDLFPEVNNHISLAIISVLINANKKKIESEEQNQMIEELHKMSIPMFVKRNAPLKTRLYSYILKNSANPSFWLKLIK